MNEHYLARAAKIEMTDASGRETMGGLDWIVVMILMAAGVLSAFSPWSFFIGGRFTPLAQWTGYGKFQVAAGHEYGLFLNLAHHQSDDLAVGTAKSNLHGSAILCTPQGEKVEYQLEGNVRNAWLQTEGQSTGLSLVAAGRQSGARKLNLHGVWRNGNLVLNDVQGDGSGLAGLATTGDKPSPATPRASVARQSKRHASGRSSHSAVIVSYGSLSNFNSFCQAQIARSNDGRLLSQALPK